MKQELEQVVANSPIVADILAAGGTVEDCVVALWYHIEELRAMFDQFVITAATFPGATFKGRPIRLEDPPRLPDPSHPANRRHPNRRTTDS